MGKFNLDTMLVQNGGPLTISSIFINLEELQANMTDKIRNAAIAATVDKAFELWGPAQTLTVRDLNGTDMSYTNNIFLETSNSGANAWNSMAFGAFTVPTATVIGIYGVKLGVIWNGTIDELPISGIRFDVGGSRVAQWQIQCLETTSSGASVAPTQFQGGITKSPIIVAEDITVTIYEYTKTASTVYTPVWLGVAVEKSGVTLKA